MDAFPSDILTCLLLLLLSKNYCFGFGARQVKEMAGFVHSPLTGRWSLSDDISVNFIAFGTKDGQ
jgi:hypothetical protein